MDLAANTNQPLGILKKCCQYLCFLVVLPCVIVSLRAWGRVGLFFFNVWATFFALFPGKIGSYLRVAYYRGVVDHLAADVNIGFGSFFSKPSVRVAEHVSIGAYCVLGSVAIGRGCEIASRVSIPSGRRQHRMQETGSESGQPVFSTIVIGEHTWIGEGAIVLADVGRHCVVGAGSVVVEPVPDGETVVGNPAKPIVRRQD